MANIRLLDNAGKPIGGNVNPFRSIDVDENHEEIKGASGGLYAFHAMNMSASVLYLKFYDAVFAGVTVGVTTPVLTIPVPTQGDTNGAGFTWSVLAGLGFDNGIVVACTTGIADNDAGAPGANAMILNAGFE